MKVHVRIPLKRINSWLEALNRVEKFSLNVSRKIGRTTIILYGSYARGDFNLWSDIDLVVVSNQFARIRLLDRYELIKDVLEPLIEPVLMSLDEFLEAISKPAWIQALRKRAVLVRDDYNLAEILVEKLGYRVKTLEELRREVAKLAEKAVEV